MTRLIAVVGMAGKELMGFFRQPRLLAVLVLGPFLILVAFGLGYRDEVPPVRTLLVVDADDARLAEEAAELDAAMGADITILDTITDRELAFRMLLTGEVDLLVIAPVDPLASLERGERALFTLVHRAIDPVTREHIGLLAQLTVDEINRAAMRDVVIAAQQQSSVLAPTLEEMEASAAALVRARETGDQVRADAEIHRLTAILGEGTLRAGLTEGVLLSVGALLGVPGGDLAGDLASLLASAASRDEEEALTASRALHDLLIDANQRLERAVALPPDTIVTPFGSAVQAAYDMPSSPAAYYAPGALILLLQHLAVSLAALSIVRERELGLTPVLRVSPVSASQALGGKYLGFVTISSVVAVILTATMIGVGVPFRGEMPFYLLTLVLVAIASVGVGLGLSAVATTSEQAVQYSMIFLLLSIFFSGFVLPLARLSDAVAPLSAAIPSTYGIAMAQDILFRGDEPEPGQLAGLGWYALGATAVAWAALRAAVGRSR